MEEIAGLLKEIFGDVVASGICRGAAPTIKFCKPYLTAVAAKASPPLAIFWGDLKRGLDNPFGLLWLMTGFSILAIAVWASIDPATAPVALWLPLMTVLCGYLVAFGLCGAKTLTARLTGCG